MRRRRKRDIIIELTSLLDVIMIMIFMVLNENNNLVQKAQDDLGTVQEECNAQAEEIDSLMEQLAEAQAKLAVENLDEIFDKLQNAESRLEAFQAIDDEVTVLNIELRNNTSNTIRYLTYGKAANPETIVRKSSNSDAAFNEACNNLKVFISDYVEQVSNDDSNSIIVCVVFSYDPNKIYQRDFESIEMALNDAKSKANSENFRCRTNPTFSD